MSISIVSPAREESDIRLSRRSKWIDLVRRIRSQYAWRCRRCRIRFYAPAGEAIAGSPRGEKSKSSRHKHEGSSRGTHPWRRLLIQGSVLLGTLILFGLFLIYIAQEHD
jgi:hypothetical protein